MLDQKKENKEFYREYHDEIIEKRQTSPFPIRRKVHEEIYESILQHIKPGMKVLDAGCGEGALSVLMAEKGANVTGVDISIPNIKSAKKRAEGKVFQGSLKYLNGDLENMPFNDREFEVVVSNHVLEHVPSFDKGLSEVLRVSDKIALIAIPTCYGLCSFPLLGRDNYWTLRFRSPISFLFGILRVLLAKVTGVEGVDEGYGSSGQHHIFRFPSVLPRKLKDKKGFNLKSFEAQSIVVPYWGKSFTTRKANRFWRNLGIGTLYFIERK